MLPLSLLRAVCIEMCGSANKLMPSIGWALVIFPLLLSEVEVTTDMRAGGVQPFLFTPCLFR